MEQFAVAEYALQQLVFDGRSAFHLQDRSVHPLDQVREIDAGGANRLAGLVVEAGLDDGPGILAPVIEIGEDEADRPKMIRLHLVQDGLLAV